MKMRLLNLLLVAAGLGVAGCVSGGPDAADVDGSAIDLSPRVVQTDGKSAGNPEKHMSVVRKGVRREAVVLVAYSSVQISLQGIEGGRNLRFWAAPVFDVGDGMQMNLFLRRGQEKIPLVGRYFDAGRKSEDRDWIANDVPLEVRQGDRLEIELSEGPQGDSTADWLAISNLRITPK